MKRPTVIISALAASSVVAVTLSACGERASEELTTTKPYADLVGREHLVVAEDLQAFGLAGGWPDRTVTSITLDTGSEFRGHQVAFRRQVPKGKVIRVHANGARAAPRRARERVGESEGAQPLGKIRIPSWT